MSAGITPSQTVGPFLAIGLPWPDGPFVVAEGTPGAIRIEGRVFDGAGQPCRMRSSRPGRPTRHLASTILMIRGAGSCRPPDSAASGARPPIATGTTAS